MIVIIALSAGIIAPLTFKELNKSKAKIEFLTVRNTLKTLTSQAFSRGHGYRVTLVDSSMTIASVNGRQVFDYEYLQFPGRSFFINHNGFPSVDVLTIKVAGQDRTLTLADILGVKQETIHVENE